MAPPTSREREAFMYIAKFVDIHPSNKLYVWDGVLTINMTM